MGYIKELINLGINLKGKTSGQMKTTCPKCGTKKDQWDLSVNIDSGVYRCHKASCSFEGGVAKKVLDEKKYTPPVKPPSIDLPKFIVDIFHKRGLSDATIKKMNIGYEPNKFFPQLQSADKAICFNYIEGGVLTNIKFRATSEKSFMMSKGSKLIVYNIDSIIDKKDVIVTEGEFDCGSYMECARFKTEDVFKNVVSVPNGATLSKTPNLEYLDNSMYAFNKAEKVYIATDDDDAGELLAQELGRRIGVDKCYRVKFFGKNDPNQLLQENGVDALARTITEAKPFPIDGVNTAEDFFDKTSLIRSNGFDRGEPLGIDDFDSLIRFVVGFTTVITGIPNHGKSEFLDFLICLLAVKRGWKFAVFSDENPTEYHIVKLAEKLIGKPMHGTGKMTDEEYLKAFKFIDDHFFFITLKDKQHTLDLILSSAKDLVKRCGVRGLVIDNWTCIEHDLAPGQSGTDYVSSQLGKISSFNSVNGVHSFVVAHPTKIQKDKTTGVYNVATQYDISGSANFFNKEDIGISVYLNYFKERSQKTTDVHIQKRRFKHWGDTGMVTFMWNHINGRYSPVFENGNIDIDNSNWLDDKNKTKTENTIPLFFDDEPETDTKQNKQYDDLPF